MGGPRVQEAMLSANRLIVLELETTREEAIARFASRDRSTDGKGVMGRPTGEVYDDFIGQVHEMRQSLMERAHRRGVRVEWHCGSAEELVKWLPCPIP